jgi:hypothetical protein
MACGPHRDGWRDALHQGTHGRDPLPTGRLRAATVAATDDDKTEARSLGARVALSVSVESRWVVASSLSDRVGSIRDPAHEENESLLNPDRVTLDEIGATPAQHRPCGFSFNEDFA